MAKIFGVHAKLSNTDWETLIGVTGTWTTNTTYNAKRRKIGDMYEYEISVVLTGAPNAVQLGITSLGSSIDISKWISGGTQTIVGSSDMVDAGTANYNGSVLVLDLTSSTPTVYPYTSTGGVSQGVTATAPFTFGNTDYVKMRFMLPIVGLSSSDILPITP